MEGLIFTKVHILKLASSLHSFVLLCFLFCFFSRVTVGSESFPYHAGDFTLSVSYFKYKTMKIYSIVQDQEHFISDFKVLGQ